MEAFLLPIHRSVLFRSGQNKSGFQAVGKERIVLFSSQGPLENETNELTDSTMKVKTLFWKKIFFNRPFYRYGGHIELIRFKEYYRMLRGHEHISFVFSSAFRDIFLKVFLE